MNASDKDGGYYAVKGFVYQFDRSIHEALENDTSDVLIEQTQDIEVNQYYIQVKHKETQKYTPSKIKPAMLQLLDNYKNNPHSKYKLYCYFKDQPEMQKHLTPEEIKKILGKSHSSYKTALIKSFSSAFELEFSSDYEKQFEALIKNIKSKFSLKTKEEAVMYHAAFRAKTLEVSFFKQKSKRVISYRVLKNLQHANEALTFELAYSKHLTNNKYLTYLRNEYFTHKKVNLYDRERLFIIHIDDRITDGAIIQIITNLVSKYYVHENSGPPYITLVGIKSNRNVSIKQRVWDQGLFFSDGTHFANDKFRASSITHKYHKQTKNKVKCKVLDESNLISLLDSHKFDDVYEFTNGLYDPLFDHKIIKKQFYIGSTSEMLNIIK